MARAWLETVLTGLVAAGFDRWEFPDAVAAVDTEGRPVIRLGAVSAWTRRRLDAYLRSGAA